LQPLHCHGCGDVRVENPQVMVVPVNTHMQFTGRSSIWINNLLN